MKNRDIKFRAWDKKDSTWIYLGMSSMLGIVDGNLRQFYTTNSGHDLDVPGLGHKEYWNPYILMQFTGLHDKNGKQIYEGDIFQSLNGRHWEVKYGEWKYWETRRPEVTKEQVQELKDEGLNSIQIAAKLKTTLSEVNKHW